MDEGIKTSAPSPGRFLQAIDASDQGDGVVVLTVADRFSSNSSANLTSGMAANQTPVRVVDTASAAGGEGLVVLAAARAAARGDTVEGVVAEADRTVARVRSVAALDDLSHLVRNGRIPSTAARLGAHLTFLFELRPSGPRPLRPALNQSGALGQMRSTFRRSIRPGSPVHVAVLHAQAPEAAAQLLSSITADCEPTTSYIGEFGPVMLAHTGPGLIGLSWYWE